MPEPTRIDVRGPRFAASVTSVLLLVATLLALLDGPTPPTAEIGWFAYQPLAGTTSAPSSASVLLATLGLRVSTPGFIAVAIVAALFVWGVVSPRTAPWGTVYRRFVQPRLAPATEFEDPRPPRFAQGVGLLVTSVGLLLYLAGVPWALPVAAAMAFAAAFLNAVFGLCLGCQLYLLLQRTGLVGRRRPNAA